MIQRFASVEEPVEVPVEVVVDVVVACTGFLAPALVRFFLTSALDLLSCARVSGPLTALCISANPLLALVLA